MDARLSLSKTGALLRTVEGGDSLLLCCLS